MRPEHTSRYCLRSKELRVAAHYWPSRRGGVYGYEASEASAEILTSRSGRRGLTFLSPYPGENYHLHKMKIFDPRTQLYSTTTKRGLGNYEHIKYTYNTINIQTNTIICNNLR